MRMYKNMHTHIGFVASYITSAHPIVSFKYNIKVDWQLGLLISTQFNSHLSGLK